MLGELIQELLAGQTLTRSDVRHWVLHSAGHRVLEHAQRELGFTDADLLPARSVLRHYGNMSSATVLFVLQQVLEHGRPQAGDWGVMAALGPGFGAEGVLLRW